MAEPETQVEIIPLAETPSFEIVRVLLGLAGTELLDFEFNTVPPSSDDDTTRSFGCYL